MRSRRTAFGLFFSVGMVLSIFTAEKAIAALPEQQLRGTWRMENVLCADGNQEIPSYSVVIMDLQDDSIGLTLSQELCEVNLQGQLRFNGRIVTTEFNRGDWASCSGSLPIPTSILNRFEYQLVRRKLHFIGNDLSPFASCQGKGGRLIFSKT